VERMRASVFRAWRAAFAAALPPEGEDYTPPNPYALRTATASKPTLAERYREQRTAEFAAEYAASAARRAEPSSRLLTAEELKRDEPPNPYTLSLAARATKEKNRRRPQQRHQPACWPTSTRRVPRAKTRSTCRAR
jgi:hypothetical protein